MRVVQRRAGRGRRGLALDCDLRAGREQDDVAQARAGDLSARVDNLLPSRQFGHMIMTTTFGIMDHEEARRRGTGGKILGFVY